MTEENKRQNFEHVFQNESGWHFVKEADVISGPFANEAQARFALGEYMKRLYGDNNYVD